MRTISLKLPDPLGAKLDRTSKRVGRSKSAIVRAALEQYLNQYLNGNSHVPPGSALEALLPWVGCFEGPKDLATNPKYMEGFGK